MAKRRSYMGRLRQFGGAIYIYIYISTLEEFFNPLIVLLQTFYQSIVILKYISYLWLFWPHGWQLEVFNGFLKQVAHVDLAPPLIPIKIILSNHFGHVVSLGNGALATCGTNKRMILVHIAPPF